MTLEGLDLANTSRPELEHVALSLIHEGGQEADVEAIRAELASRTWQHHNPYAADGGNVTPPAKAPIAPRRAGDPFQAGGVIPDMGRPGPGG